MKIMGWKPPQRPKWVKEIMQTPGYIKVQLSLLMILATSSVLSTGLQITSRVNNTSAGSISYRNESLEAADAGGRVRVTGSNTGVVLRNLMMTGNAWGRIPLVEKSFPPTPPSEE